VVSVQQLSDCELLEETQKLVQREREILSLVLKHLREVARRRLFSTLGYTSSFDYCVRHLKYSEDQASRRIAAMKLMSELPEIEEKISNGRLTLSHLGMAQTLFRAEEKLHTEKMARAEKIEVLESLEGKSYREAQRIVVSRSSEPMTLMPDQVRVVSDTKVEVRFLADPALLEKIERVKGLLAHKHPNMSLADVVDYLTEMAIEKLDPSRKAPRKTREKSPTDLVKEEESGAKTPLPAAPRVNREKLAAAVASKATLPFQKAIDARARSRTIPTAIRRELWRRQQAKCARCGSQRTLQIEHIQPWALGGSNDARNLTLLCRTCNQRSAIEYFGLSSMQKYLNLI